MHNVEKLEIHQRSYQNVLAVYHLTKDLPKDENFGLSSQIRRSAVSIPSNIAEGAGRGSDRSFNHFLNIALGSACELETQLNLIHDIYGVDIQKVFKENRTIRNQIQRLVSHLERKIAASG